MPRRYKDDDARKEDYYRMAVEVGNRVRAARAMRDVTQHEVSDKMKRSPGWIGMLETGRTLISLYDLKELAEALELPMTFFVEGATASPAVPHRPGDWYKAFPDKRDWAEAFATLHKGLEDLGEDFFDQFSDPVTAAAHIMLQAAIDKNTVRDAKNGRREYVETAN